MSHFGDYMDGVPVKISEKYIRPPKIELPYSVVECGPRAQSILDNVKYCSQFENNVLSKLKELRSAKETKKNERRHRLQLLEEAKQKKLDAIAAAEAEEKLKQLSVSEVSYPSTEEISEISPDDKTDKNCDTLTNEEIQDNIAEITNIEYHYPSCSIPPDSQLNILQPIQVKSNYLSNNLLDDPDPLQEIKMQNKSVQFPQYSLGYSKHNIDTLTYKDFENDTSSPFDNVELKTINDMELLAQVLQSQRESATSCPPQPQFGHEETFTNMPNCASQAQIEGMPYLPNSYMEQTIQGPGVMYTSPQHYPVANGYYIATENCDNTIPMDNVYMPNYQYYIPANPYTANTSYYNQVVESNEINNTSNDSTYIPQPYYFNYPQIPLQYNPPYYDAAALAQSSEITYQNPPDNSQNTVKSRSRSVPDIVRELNEEVVSAKLRANERSFNASPSPREVPQPSSSGVKKEEKKNKRKSEHLPNPYDKLSMKTQNMCHKIHGMGFPLDRVARVCTLVGENDKKVIEGLLILGELMDLGFSESRVFAVLAKHEFNREKALDELVS